MRNRSLFTVIVIFALMLTTHATVLCATAPEGVSPGVVDRLVRVEHRCPTFNWVAAEGTLYFELVAYSLPDYLDDASIFRADLAGATEVLYATVPGGATGWTPSSELCMAPGGRYVWFVRAVNQVRDDEVVEASEWSRGRFFAIPAGPTEDEMSRALDVLRRWEASGGGGVVALSAGVGTQRSASRAVGRQDGPRSLKSVPTASAAIRGSHPEGTGETYGVVGASASPQGAGLGAANTAGGPDLVLDGSADGLVDTAVSESGIDRSSSTDETFTLMNSGTGRLHLDVVGDVFAHTVDTEELKISGSTVIDDTGEWMGVGSTVPCSGCVGSSDIQDQSIGTDDLAINAVTSTRILNATIQSWDLVDDIITSAKIAPGQVLSSHIGDGTILAADLATNAVTSIKIVDGTILAADLDVGSVVSDKIRDNAVISAHIADGAVGSSEIANNAVTASDIATGAVTSLKILNDTITSADIAANSITSGDIAPSSIGTSELQINAVTTSEVLDGTLTAADVSSTGGIYASKSGVYVVDETCYLPDHACTGLAVACADANDLPVQGVCAVPYPDVVFTSDLIEYWDSETQAAEYICHACNDSLVLQSFTATIACVSVPGP